MAGFTLSEPTTVATDYALAILGVWWGIALWRDGRRRLQWAPRLLAACFLVMAVGAVLGGTAHGFVRSIETGTLALIWRATTISLGAAGYLLLAAAVTASLGGWAGRVVLGLGGLKLGVYIAWMTRHHEFHWVLAEYGSSMLAVAMLMIWRADRTSGAERIGPRWFLGGVLLSVVGAAVQAGGLAPHPHFNHNDLYHVIQMVALYCFYRGGRRLVDLENPP